MLSDRLTALIRNPDTPTYVLRDAVREEEPTVASVFVVSGETGEYSDKRSWAVAAYLERVQAEAVADRLNQWCSRQRCGWAGEGYCDRPKGKPPDDPHFECDTSTGTGYVV